MFSFFKRGKSKWGASSGKSNVANFVNNSTKNESYPTKTSLVSDCSLPSGPSSAACVDNYENSTGAEVSSGNERADGASNSGLQTDLLEVNGSEEVNNVSTVSNIATDNTCDVNETVTRSRSTQELNMCDETSDSLDDLYNREEEDSTSEFEDAHFDHSEEGTEAEEEGETESDDDDEDDKEDSGNVSMSHTQMKDDQMKHFMESEIEKRRVLNVRLETSEKETNRLMCRVEELQREVMVKTGGIDRLQAELDAAYKESECVHMKLKKMDEDYTLLKQLNQDLSEKLQLKECIIKEACLKEIKETTVAEEFDFNRLLQLEDEVKDLRLTIQNQEELMSNLRKERDKLQQGMKVLGIEREEEVRLIKQALNRTVTERDELQLTFGKEFEKLRTVHTEREEQLLKDFEWKLREVEQFNKRRLDEKEKSLKQDIINLQHQLDSANEEITKLNGFRQFEAEAKQLRGLNLDQQRALRIAERTKEQLQVSEKVLQEEIKNLEELLEKEKTKLSELKELHTREINEINLKMESRLDHQNRELNNQIEALKQEIEESKSEYKQNIEHLQSQADCKIFELRRKLDRIDLSYEDKLEKINKDHEREKVEQSERLTQERDRIIAELEEEHQNSLAQMKTELLRAYNDREQELVEEISSMRDELTEKNNLIEDLSLQTGHLKESLEELNEQITCKTHQHTLTEEEVEQKIRQVQDESSQTINELRKSLRDKENQVAQLSKDKHLYQLQLMNRYCHGENVPAKRHKKRQRNHHNKPGSSQS